MILNLWTSLSRIPMGKNLFNLILYFLVPYSSSIFPKVLNFQPGEVSVKMKDRRKVRNHLNSIHAVALTNLGELASGLALTSKIPSNARAILTHLEIEFEKKARGTLIATSKFNEDMRDIRERSSHIVTAIILNSKNEIVAEVKASWLIGPKDRH